jgi:hypothetical protein
MVGALVFGSLITLSGVAVGYPLIRDTGSIITFLGLWFAILFDNLGADAAAAE